MQPVGCSGLALLPPSADAGIFVLALSLKPHRVYARFRRSSYDLV